MRAVRADPVRGAARWSQDRLAQTRRCSPPGHPAGHDQNTRTSAMNGFASPAFAMFALQRANRWHACFSVQTRGLPVGCECMTLAGLLTGRSAQTIAFPNRSSVAHGWPARGLQLRGQFRLGALAAGSRSLDSLMPRHPAVRMFLRNQSGCTVADLQGLHAKLQAV